MLVVIELGGRISCPQNVDAGKEVIGPDLWATQMLNADDADLDIAAALAAEPGEHRQTATVWDQPPSAWASAMKSGIPKAIAIGVPMAVDEPM